MYERTPDVVKIEESICVWNTLLSFVKFTPSIYIDGLYSWVSDKLLQLPQLRIIYVNCQITPISLTMLLRNTIGFYPYNQQLNMLLVWLVSYVTDELVLKSLFKE